MKNSLRNTLYLLFLLSFLGCAGKRPVADQPPAPVQGPEPIAEPNQPSGQQPTPVPSRNEVPVALVLGGAGVASFATVGIFKRLQEEGVRVDFIVTTGWPTLFCLGHGFLKSVHDLEWFATRLKETDLYQVGIFDSKKGFSSHDNLSSLIENAFKQREIQESRVPLIISATNTELGEPETFDRGEWREPLLKTMSIPGIYRPYKVEAGKEWVTSLQGLDVEEAVRRGAKYIVAIQMYDDYFRYLKNAEVKETQKLFRQLYLAQLKRSIQKELKQANLIIHIPLDKQPGDFSAKRAAILAGYREGGRIARLIRSSAN